MAHAGAAAPAAANRQATADAQCGAPDVTDGGGGQELSQGAGEDGAAAGRSATRAAPDDAMPHLDARPMRQVAGEQDAGGPRESCEDAARARNPLAAVADGRARATDAPWQGQIAPPEHAETQWVSDLESALAGSMGGVDGGGPGDLVAFEAQDPGMSEAWIVGGQDAKIMTSRGDLATLAARLSELESMVAASSSPRPQELHP